MDVTCYVLDGKAKSELICKAFASGVRACGGTAQLYAQSKTLQPGAAVFYGVRPHQKGLLDLAIREGRDWYYVDNAYFDSTRERYFRITRNRLQHVGLGESDGSRFKVVSQPIKPWRKAGNHILVCPQSDEFLNLFCPAGAQWTEQTVKALRSLTQREIRVRAWNSDKVNWYKTLPEDLDDCWALVTYSSASAITAMCAGIPAFVTARDCIARVVANTDLTKIEDPTYTADLLGWAEVVADNQFSVAEIAAGYAWRRLREAANGGL